MTAILRVEEVQRQLAELRTVDEVRDVRDKAQAILAYQRTQRASLGAQNDSAEIKLRAERRLGELLAETVQHQGGRPAKLNGEKQSHRATVLPDGVTRSDSARWQREAAVPDDAFAAYVAGQRDTGGEITTAGLLRVASGSAPAANWSSESVEWYTPGRYIEAARATLGGIDLDPASSAKANETIRAKRIFTAEADGLSKAWKGRVWLNPPYGEHEGESNAGRWARYLIAQYRAGATTAAVLLVNAVTDRRWFQPLWDFPICFTDHRIEFSTPTGQPRSPVSGNAFVYLGPDMGAFLAAFSPFGPVVGRIDHA